MTITERVKLIASLTNDLTESIEIYDKASESGTKYVWAGNTVDYHHSKGAIQRRITEIRQQLLQLTHTFNN